MGEAETRQKLLRNVKKEVKQIMEESVTRKFVHADSSHIISFCAVVEACVLHGLKRRAAGLLCSNKVAALFMKVGKSFTPAEELCQKVQELEQLIETNRQAQLNNGSVQKQPGVTNLPPQGLRNLWIRTALMEKLLDKIVMYLVENSSTFYDSEAILMDPVDGPILASLLVGPCALEYTKVKTADHFWTDPSADELVQRHRIHSGHCRQDSPSRRPALIQKRQSSGSMEDRPILWARDYVESLHQNNRATLLFGKNNVLVQPRDDMEAIPGYLSLHQTADLMTLKWTPNQLMNGNVADDTEKSVYWDFAMTIRLEEIVYLHCHQQVDSGGTVVLVSQDGIQRPPLRFPRGGHLLQFLTCLETGLLPHGQLDPPLWSQRGKGKVFPKLRKRSPQGSVESVSDKEEDEATDYVFRILLPGTPSDFVAPELMDQAVNMWHPTPRKSSCFSCSQNGSPVGSLPNGCNQDRAPLKLLCDTMKYQIISRAFYGWLAYCRHLSTVRIHLSALVNPTIVDPNVPHDARGGLTVDVWSSFLQDCSAYDEHELLRLVYYGGVAPTIRKEVWPFLLGHYHFDMTQKHRLEVDEQVRAYYEQTMKEWLGCEAIVKQREGEKHAEAIAKCNSVERPGPVQRDSTISTDSSQSTSSEKQIAQSDSSSSTQAFGSVEEVDQIESEMKPEEGKEVSKIPLKDCPDVANPNVTSESGDPPKKISVGSGLPEQPQSTNNNNPATKGPATDLTVKTVATQPSPEPSEPQGAASRPVAEAQAGSKLTEDLPVSRSTEEPKVTITVDDKAGEEHPKAPTQESKAPESKEVECSESVEIIQIPERVKERGSNKEDVKSLVNTETENKVAGNGLSEVSTTKDPKLPVRAAYATENTDILKLETEVSNVYIPAPPLGEATVNKTQESKAPVSEPSCATEPSLTEGNKASTIAVEAGIAEKEDPNFSDIEEITESELQTIKTPQTSEACVCEKDMDSTEEKVSEIAKTKTLDTVEASVPEKSNTKAAEMTVAIDSEKHAPCMPVLKPPQLEARASVTVTAHSMRSPDTLDSDDSPSALEMEDIPTAWARPLSGLMAPPAAPFLALGRVVSGEPVLHASSNTSLDGTEPTLSEEEPEMESLYPQSDFLVVTDELKPEVSPVVVSPAGTTYSQEQLDLYLLNLHRIDKDVRRCDRTYWYFTPANLEKLRNIMCSYVWQHLEIGYVQGMCDLLAPLLVVLDDEVMAFSCFSELMKRMNQNFPHGGAMDSHFANMRSLIQILDSELFELMQMNGDYTHFYFCYRWFLLDFKREMLYDDVFSVWETIWAATYTSSTHFVLFIALALVEIYRDIILENNMDFTDIIKFFNEMAEHHNIPQVLTMARDLVLKVQTLIENK
ncbi:small G protein signaling modulator 1 isoform X1 [Salmo trutta]|uniref:Small G protein signaling modulator 1-like n=1 Tax=Salmo trutta TaxID=8032 RepID=A0A674EMD9_SALTR|nr:small G protein signaling modulator 1-like isoform X1 [Salmo trutta]